MTRRLGTALAVSAAAAAALAACPLPQPLPGVAQPTDGGTVAAPRIETASVRPSDTVIFYEPSACPTPDGGTGGAQFALHARILDDDTEDIFEARWFVDYSATAQSRYTMVQRDASNPPTDPNQDWRDIPDFSFAPAGWPTPPGELPSGAHVVELVISNGFADLAASPPNRAVLPGYESQIFRWLFFPKAGGSCGP